MFLPAIITMLAFVFLLLKLSTRIRRRLLGYDFAFDVVVTLGLAWLFGTATISALMTAITTGFLFSIAIYITKHLGHYERLERKGRTLVWVTREGNWRASCGRMATAIRRIIDGADAVA